MRPLKLIAASLLLSGCSALPPFSAEQRVEKAMSTDDFRRAAAIIDNASRRHPDYHALQSFTPALSERSAEASQQALLQARQYASQEHWRDALEVLDHYQPKVLDPSPLQALREEIIRQQQSHLKRLRSDYRLALAQAVLGTRQEQAALEHIPLRAASKEISQQQQLRQQLATELNQLGEHYAEREDWQQAKALLSAAHKLAPEQPPSPYLATAEEHLGHVYRQVQAQQQQQRQQQQQQRRQEREQQLRRTTQQANRLLQRYQLSGELNDLLAARQFVRQHAEESALQAQQRQLDAWSQAKFSAVMEQAQSLYASGQYHQAHRLWRSIAPLYPEDETLNTMLERSERVLRNMQGLETR